MESELFTEEHKNFRQMVADFIEHEVDPHAEEWNEAGELPRELWLKMGTLGFLGISYEKKYGGSELDFMYSIIFAEELTRSRCSGIAMAVCVHKDMSSNYILAGSEELRMKHIPPCITGEAICGIAVTEPGGGSDIAAIQTKATRDGDQYTINGQKTFITNGYKGDLVVVAVKTDPTASPPHRGISLVLVEKDTAGFSKGEKLKKMGTVASDTTDLFFEDCRVPVAHLLGEENGGFKIIMQNFELERLVATAIYVTACEEMLKETVAHCQEHNPLNQSTKHNLVELFTETELAKVFLYESCRHFMKRGNVRKEVSMNKYFASELANKVAYHCVSLYGPYGFMKECPISQWYTDVRLYNIGAGTTEIMKEVITKSLGL